MVTIARLFHSTAFLFLLISSQLSEPSLAKPLEKLAKGRPAHMGEALPGTSYVPHTAKKLTQAELLWVNSDWLEDKEVDVPEEGFTPEFIQKVVNLFGWAIPSKNQNPDLYSEEEMTFYVDFYGGTGISLNFGSGRAGSIGIFQLKGFGQTEMIGEGTPFDHANGGAALEEGVREAIWGEVFEKNLPYGANRVVAVLITGEDTVWPDGGRDPRVIIVREDPIRPAHYLVASMGLGEFRKSEKKRNKKAIQFLATALPVPIPVGASKSEIENIEEKFREKPRNEQFNLGFEEFSKRTAEQFAVSFVKRLFHGAITESNIEIKGKMLDYGTASAVPDHGYVKTLGYAEAFGDYETIANTIIKATLREWLENKEFKEIYDHPRVFINRYLQVFQKTYEECLLKELLLLTGVPPSMVNNFLKNPAIQEFVYLLIEIIDAGQVRAVNIDKNVPEQVSKNSLPKIFSIAAELISRHSVWKVQDLELALENELADSKLREKFAKGMVDLQELIIKSGEENNIEKRNLLYYQAQALRLRNRDLSDLYRPKMREKIWTLNRETPKHERTERFQDYIDRTIEKHTAVRYHGFEIETPVSFELGPSFHKKFKFIKSYNAVTGQTMAKISVRFPYKKQKAFKGSVLIYSFDNWKTKHEVTRNEESGEFIFPLREAQSVEFVIRNEESTLWWKAGKENFRFENKGEVVSCAAPFLKE